jgi:predicted Zn-dependent protease
MRKLLLVLIVCIFIQPVFGQSGANDDYTLVDAYYLGRAVAANILSNYRPYTRSPEATQYLNRICQTLVINSNHLPAFKGYSIMILDSNEINAFATPGGHVFVTRRLVELATSEDLLAAVIAHELAHIMLRHGIAMINETRFETEMSGIADRAASIAARNSPAAAQAANFRSSITKTVDILMRQGYSQAQEFEADLEAILLLARAGYDPRAMLDMLRILQQAQGTQRTGFYSTHPSPFMRIANIERLNYRNPNTGQYRMPRFRNLKL